MWRAERLLTGLNERTIDIDDAQGAERLLTGLNERTIDIIDDAQGIDGTARFSINQSHNTTSYSIESTEHKSCFEFVIYTNKKVGVLLSIAYRIQDIRNCNMNLRRGKPADFFMAIFEKVCRENHCVYAILNDDAYIRACSDSHLHGMGATQMTNKMIMTTGTWFYHKWGYMPIYNIDIDHFDEDYDELQEDEQELNRLFELFKDGLDDRPKKEDFINANLIEQESLLLDYVHYESSLEDLIANENNLLQFYNKTSYEFITKMKDYLLKFFDAVRVYLSKTIPDELEKISNGECADILTRLKIHEIDIAKIPFPLESEEGMLLRQYSKWIRAFSLCQIKYFRIPS